MKILLFLCTIYYVHCNLLLSQVHAEIVEGGSQNLNTTNTTTTTTTEIPFNESDSDSDSVTTNDFVAETVNEENPVDEQVLDDGSETPDADEFKTDAVKESPVDLTLTPDVQEDASELQETATDNIESDVPETPDGDDHIVPSDNEQEIADVTETPVEQNQNAETKIPEDQKTDSGADAPIKEVAETETKSPIETKTSTEENSEDNLKIAKDADPEIPVEAETKTKAEENSVEDTKPDREDSKSATETKTVAEQTPEIKTESVAEPEIPTEQKTSNDDTLESTSEPETSVEDKSDSNEEQDDDVESETEVEEITETNQKNDTNAEIKIEELSDANSESEALIKNADVIVEEKTKNDEKETSIEAETKSEDKSSEESKIVADPETPVEQKPESAESKTDIEETKLDQKISTETENTTPTVEASEEEDDTESKYISSPSDITIEHIDFVQLRLAHIAKKTTSNITELRLLQAKEFEKNEIYKKGWAAAVELFDDQKKKKIYKGFSTKSAVRTVPDDYHIALIAYTLAYPGVYADFNKKTREVCSGKDVDAYDYQSYFKLLLLAIEYLGSEMKFRSGNRFLYRGVSSKFALEVGQILAFQHFQSTSSSLMIAEDFAGKTLFEIQGKFDTTAVSIRDHSRFRHEDEVLFSPFQVYQVESIHEGKYYTRYVLIGHDLPRSGACDLNLRTGGTQAPQQLRREDKNGALLKRSSNNADYASASNRMTANSVIGLFSVFSILISFVL